MEGIPVTRTISSRDVFEMLNKSFQSVEEGIIHALEICPPELSADIYQTGIHVTGGGALLRGIRERLQYVLQLPIHLDADPLRSVSKGIAMALRDPRKFRPVLFE